jgi:hypothetical protein
VVVRHPECKPLKFELFSGRELFWDVGVISPLSQSENCFNPPVCASSRDFGEFGIGNRPVRFPDFRAIPEAASMDLLLRWREPDLGLDRLIITATSTHVKLLKYPKLQTRRLDLQ